MWVATKSRARGVALLDIVVQATTFVVLLAIITILLATRLMWDLIGVSLITSYNVPLFINELAVALKEVNIGLIAQ
jgi:hypothetical protein